VRTRSFAECPVILFVLGVAVCGADPEPMAVELATPRTAYLLGEPIPLDVAIRNVSGRKLRAFRIPPVYVRILVGREGHALVPIRQETVISTIALRRTTLEPDGSWKYQIRALYHFDRDRPRGQEYPPDLAMPEPGSYTIRVEVPLIGVVVEGNPAVVEGYYIASNPIRVEVRAPEGEDAEILRELRDWEVLLLLREGRFSTRRAVRTAARLLQEHPQTGYRECLNWALREHLGSPNDLPPEEQERIRNLLDAPPE
jgi:hypothetical protein